METETKNEEGSEDLSNSVDNSVDFNSIDSPLPTLEDSQESSERNGTPPITKPTFKSSLQAKKRLHAFRSKKQLQLNCPSKKVGDEGDKTSKKAKKEIYPDDKLKNTIKEIEDLKMRQRRSVNDNDIIDQINKINMEIEKTTVFNLPRPRSESQERENRFRKVEVKSRNYRRSTIKSPTPEPSNKSTGEEKKEVYGKTWADYKHLSIKKVDFTKSSPTSSEFYKIFTFATPSTQLNDYKVKTEGGLVKVPFRYIRQTKARPHIFYNVNQNTIKETHINRRQLYDIIPNPRKEFMENMFKEPSKLTPNTGKMETRNWYPKSWRKTDQAEAKLLENSFGLLFLQGYSDEEEGELVELTPPLKEDHTPPLKEATPPLKEVESPKKPDAKKLKTDELPEKKKKNATGKKKKKKKTKSEESEKAKVKKRSKHKVKKVKDKKKKKKKKEEVDRQKIIEGLKEKIEKVEKAQLKREKKIKEGDLGVKKKRSRSESEGRALRKKSLKGGKKRSKSKGDKAFRHLDESRTPPDARILFKDASRIVGSPDSEAYNSHWESEDDFTFPSKDVLNKSWESDEEVFTRSCEKTVKPIVKEDLEIPLDFIKPKKAPIVEEKLEIPLEIKTPARNVSPEKPVQVTPEKVESKDNLEIPLEIKKKARSSRWDKTKQTVDEEPKTLIVESPKTPVIVETKIAGIEPLPLQINNLIEPPIKVEPNILSIEPPATVEHDSLLEERRRLELEKLKVQQLELQFQNLEENTKKAFQKYDESLRNYKQAKSAKQADEKLPVSEVKTEKPAEEVVNITSSTDFDIAAPNPLEDEYAEFMKAVAPAKKDASSSSEESSAEETEESDVESVKIKEENPVQTSTPVAAPKPVPVPSPQQFDILPKPLLNLTMPEHIALSPLKVVPNHILPEVEKKPVNFAFPTKKLIANTHFEADEDSVEEVIVVEETRNIETDKKPLDTEDKKPRDIEDKKHRDIDDKKPRDIKTRDRSRSPLKRKSSGSPRRRPASPIRRSRESPDRRRPGYGRRSPPRRRALSPLTLRRPKSPPGHRRRRSPSPRRLKRRSPSPRSKRRSISPKSRPTSPKRRKSSPEKTIRKSPATHNSSPLEGLKKSVADSTISDDLLPQPNITDDYTESPLTRFYDKNMGRTVDSPKRMPLDIRINQELGIEKIEPPPMNTYEAYQQYNQYLPPYGYSPKPSQISPSIIPPLPVVKTTATNKVVQVGNMLQIVPREDIKVASKNKTPTTILQVGNMLQIVPQNISPPPKPPEPVEEPTTSTTIEVPPPPPEKPSIEDLMKQKISERRAEREKRRLEREKRRKEKEKRRKEKEKEKQMKLKLKTESMIRKALQQEDLEEDEEEVEEAPHQWPPLPAVYHAPVKVGKSILVRGGSTGKRKSVHFADGVRPGEGTSPSGGEELSSPPPTTKKLPKEKRYKKTKVPKKTKKKKVRVKVVKKQEDSDEEDHLPPPSPPPGSPPPHIFPPRVKTHTVNNLHPSFAPSTPPIQTNILQQNISLPVQSTPPTNYQSLYRPPPPPVSMSVPLTMPPPVNRQSLLHPLHASPHQIHHSFAPPPPPPLSQLNLFNTARPPPPGGSPWS